MFDNGINYDVLWMHAYFRASYFFLPVFVCMEIDFKMILQERLAPDLKSLVLINEKCLFAQL